MKIIIHQYRDQSKEISVYQNYEEFKDAPDLIKTFKEWDGYFMLDMELASRLDSNPDRQISIDKFFPSYSGKASITRVRWADSNELFKLANTGQADCVIVDFIGTGPILKFGVEL